MKFSKEQILGIVKSKDWDIQGFNAYPLYLMCAATESGWLVKNKFAIGYTHFFYFFSNGRAYMYYDRQDWENICNGYYETIISREQLEKYIEEYKSNYQKLLKDSLYDLDELNKLSRTQLILLFNKLCNTLIHAVGAAHGIEGITYGSEKKLRDLLSQKGTFNEQEFGLVCSPTYPSFLFEAQNELRRIKSLVGNNKNVAIDTFIANYGWIENTYLGKKLFSPTDVINRINGLKEDSTNTNVEEISSQKAKILGRFDLSNQENFVITTIELCFHWQDERKKYILQLIGALDPVLEEVAKHLAIEATDLKFANPDEILESNLSNKDFQLQLKKRREKSVCYSIPGQNYVFINSDYDFFSENLHIEFANDTKEIKGVVASSGVVRGIVRICESVSDIDKVQEGEILVASMTRPEYLPAMQRAVAFITDEGGITSHAAIISREFGIPCIIGTKIATKVLHDGDLVEVDADKGIVKILKNN